MVRSRLSLVHALVLGSSSALLLHCGSGDTSGGPADGGRDATTDTSSGGDSSARDSTSGDAGTDTSAGNDSGVGDSGFDAGPACDPQHPCVDGGDAGTIACCSGFCTDTARDPRNCGMCSNACSATQFCTGTQCDDAVFANLCVNRNATVVFDPFPSDNDAGSTLGMAMVSTCNPPTTLVQVSQSAPGVLDPDSGQPLLGVGNTLIAGGGSFGQNAVGYMDNAGVTPIYLTSDGTTAWFKNRAGTALVTTPVSNLTAHHDYFFLELAVEPQLGTLCFFGVGMFSPGTLAAGYWGATQLIPNAGTDTKSWYAYEWTDTNNDSVPNAGDTFNLIASGP